MIVAIKIRNFKAINRIPVLEVAPFHILVGPNGSGKSTFLDAIEFVKSCLVHGPLKAVEERVPEFRDLTFKRQGGPIEIDLTLQLQEAQADPGTRLHYRLCLTADDRLGVKVSEEGLEKVSNGKARGAGVRILGKRSSGNDFYRRESGTYEDSFQFGPGKLALSLTPPDTDRYPTGNAVKAFLMEGVRYIQLNSAAMRQPAPATRPTELELDGTNLPRVVGRLLKSTPEGAAAVARWTEHLRYALEDLDEIGWAARQPDNAEFLVLKQKGGLQCPNWLLSDGTLRMLALTLPAFIPGEPRVNMVEEPENGVHPHALEIILKALAGIPKAQVFVATHSPLVVQQAGIKPLLCFARDEQIGVHIIHGPDHPVLKDWQGTPDLGSIFASRVLG